MSDTSYNLKIIVLGAGKSERFEGIKLIAAVTEPTDDSRNSTLLIQHVLQQIVESLAELNIDKSNLSIATGGYYQQISEVLDPELSIINCSNAHLGLGYSIAQSVDIVLNNANNKLESTSHIMITLADQIALKTDDYVRLIEQSISKPDKLICAKAEEQFMPPAIFPRRYFSQLMELNGDKGAKALLQKNRDSLQEVLLANAAIDIDTQHDLLIWKKSNLIHL